LSARLDGKGGYFLRLAIVEHGKVFFCQTGGAMSRLVGHYDIRKNEPGCDVQSWSAELFNRGLIRQLTRSDPHADKQEK